MRKTTDTRMIARLAGHLLVALTVTLFHATASGASHVAMGIWTT